MNKIKMRIHMLLFKMLSEFPKIQYNYVHNHIDRNIEWNISRNTFISVIKKMKEHLTNTAGCHNFVEFCRKFGHLYIPEERPVILFNRD